MSSKLRLVLAGLTAAALIGGVMVADPADAGKKKKHKKVKVVKVKKVKKGNSVKQVSKGGNAKAGNGGNGGAGGSSGNVYNTGNVNGAPAGPPVPGPGAGLPDDFVACLIAATDGGLVSLPEEMDVCEELLPEPGLDAFPAFTACLGTPSNPDGEIPFWPADQVLGCLVDTLPGSGGGGGSVFSGDAGNGATGGDGGDAVGGTGGSNSNSSTRTVTSDDHSIDVDA